MRASVVALSSLSLGLAGCLTTGVVQTAETSGQDNFQFAFEPGVTGVAASADGGGGGVAGPSFNLSARYGVSDKVDIGGRFGTTLIELSVKAMVTEVNPDELQISIAPHVGGLAVGAGGEGGGFLWVRVPVLFDVPIGQSDLVIGPTARVTTLFGGGAGGVFIDAGSSLGYAARVGDRSRIIPEIGFSIPLLAGAADGQGNSGAIGLGNGLLFSFQVGVVLGGRSRSGE